MVKPAPVMASVHFPSFSALTLHPIPSPSPSPSLSPLTMLPLRVAMRAASSAGRRHPHMRYRSRTGSSFEEETETRRTAPARQSTTGINPNDSIVTNLNRLVDSLIPKRLRTHQRALHSRAPLASTAPAEQSAAATPAGGCGGGCACAAAAAASQSSPSVGDAASVVGGCGRSGCGCAPPPPVDPERVALESRLSTLQGDVSRLYRDGEYEPALTHAHEANDIAIKLFGDHHPATASTYNNLALLYRVHRQEYQRAAELYQSAIAAYKESVGESHPSYLTCINNLGLTYRSLGDLSRAHSTLIRVVDFYRGSLDESALKTSLPYAQAQMNLAAVVRDRTDGNTEENRQEAIALFRSALKIAQRKYGDEHPLVATIMNNLGLTYKCANDLPNALSLYQSALGIRSRNLPPRHPDLIITLNNLAECLRAMGQEEKAQAIQQKMMQIMEADENDAAQEAEKTTEGKQA